MGTQRVGLQDVNQGQRPSRLRILAPLRYLAIRDPEKDWYDFIVPMIFGVGAWAIYLALTPKPQLFGDAGLLKFARDLLIMAVPFMVGALAAVAMGAPGPHIDRRPIGVNLRLDGEQLTLRQFVCYMLGYLCFLGLITLAAVVAAELAKDLVLSWTADAERVRLIVHGTGALVLSLLLSFLSITVFWSLYFLTVVVNRT